MIFRLIYSSALLECYHNKNKRTLWQIYSVCAGPGRISAIGDLISGLLLQKSQDEINQPHSGLHKQVDPVLIYTCTCTSVKSIIAKDALILLGNKDYVDT